MPQARIPDAMKELLRTNDIVLISLVESILEGAGIGCFVADRFMSAMEGSVGFLPRRVMVPEHQHFQARRTLQDAGLEAELPAR